MKLIKPSFEILEQSSGIEGIYKMIEIAGRTAYKSEDKITEDSAKKFVDRMIKLNHSAPLEHGTVYLKIPIYATTSYRIDEYESNPYSKTQISMDGESCYYITTNMNVLVEHNWLDDLQYLCEPTKYHKRRICVRFICDRGVSHEFVRHRVFSFLQESQRYVGSSTVIPINEYNCDKIEDIIKAYQQGFSMKNISDNSSYSECKIRNILLENNIQIRGLNNKGNRIEDYFSSIDTSEKAYLLGLIQTGGNVTDRKKHSMLSITQHEDYAWYIEDMLLDFSSYICNVKDKKCRQLQLGSKTLVNDLIKLGIVPNKVKNQTDSNIITLWESVPDEFKGDFIRGCIDGDGYVTFFTQKDAINESCNIGFCSVKEILVDKIINFIYSKFNYKCGKCIDGNIYKLYISDRKKAIEIGDYLYSNFKYPFGHPKKASTWIKRIGKSYPIADYKDYKFKIIKPLWIDNSSPESIFNFIKAMDCCENSYTKLRMSGWKPQQAREVLPNATKTELIMTGFIDDWWGEYLVIDKSTGLVDQRIHGKFYTELNNIDTEKYRIVEKGFFPLRCSKSAHPQAQELAVPLRETFINQKIW